MGLFGKGKKEIERENEEIWYQKNYGISKMKAESFERCLISNYTTDNIDAMLKLKAPQLIEFIGNIYKGIINNQKKIDILEEKYDKLLQAFNKQNELLSALSQNSNKS